MASTGRESFPNPSKGKPSPPGQMRVNPKAKLDTSQIKDYRKGQSVFTRNSQMGIQPGNRLMAARPARTPPKFSDRTRMGPQPGKRSASSRKMRKSSR